MISKLIAVFVTQMAAVFLALTLCRGWLVFAAERVFGFYNPAGRHDSLNPGEGQLFLAVYCLGVAAAVFLALLAIQRLSKGTVPIKVAVGMAGPAAFVAFEAFQHTIERMILTLVLPEDAVLIVAIVGSLIGSLIPRGSHPAVGR